MVILMIMMIMTKMTAAATTTATMTIMMMMMMVMMIMMMMMMMRMRMMMMMRRMMMRMMMMMMMRRRRMLMMMMMMMMAENRGNFCWITLLCGVYFVESNKYIDQGWHKNYKALWLQGLCVLRIYSSSVKDECPNCIGSFKYISIMLKFSISIIFAYLEYILIKCINDAWCHFPDATLHFRYLSPDSIQYALHSFLDQRTSVLGSPP